VRNIILTKIKAICLPVAVAQSRKDAEAPASLNLKHEAGN